MKTLYAFVLLLALGLAPTLWGANNPDITVGLVAGGQNYVRIGEPATLRATLIWPDGTPLSSGVFTWSSSPEGALRLSQTSQPGSTMSEVVIVGVTPAQATVNVHWQADQGGYSSPDANKNVLVLDVRVEVGGSAFTLMDETEWKAKVLPEEYVPTNVRFEVKRRGINRDWISIFSGGPVSSMTHRVAGTIEVRCKVDIDAVGAVDIESSNTETIEVHFPTSDRIVVRARPMMDQAWASTLAATTPTSRREEGFYITLDTATDTYGETAHTLGPTTGPNEGAEWPAAYPRPPDSIPDPIPYQDAPIYTVAWFHTHTPTTYRPLGREAGPSTPDKKLVCYVGHQCARIRL